MDQHIQLIDRFYSAFQARDAAGMIACYHPDVQFSDPVFTDLRGARAGAMWTMLCERGTDLRIEYGDLSADEHTGRAHWEAWYTFSGSGRKVHNVVEATFGFRDGLIARHADSFDLRAWAAQALGLPGRVLGGSSFMQNKIRANGMKALDAYTRRSAQET